LAALEVFYQNAFERRKAVYNESEKKKWNAALTLDEAGCKTIKGHDLM
jgi:hypothetical protein